MIQDTEKTENIVKERRNGSPNGIRTRVSALRGLRPKPLDDGAKLTRSYQTIIKEIRFQKIRFKNMKKFEQFCLVFSPEYAV